MALCCRRVAKGRVGLAVVVAAAAWGTPALAAPAKKPPSRNPAHRTTAKPAAVPNPEGFEDASTPFFRDLKVPRLKIQISDENMEKLRGEERVYVPCTIVEDDKKSYENVGVKLKGAAGSSRPIDDKPALTLNFDKFNKELKFHDLDKVHLNNSVQDPTYLSELICSEVFLAAGIPTPRTTHARVWLNGRDLGMFVLKEGFDKHLLKVNGLDPKGNLYEGGFVQDLDGDPQLESGDGAKERQDVAAVLAACQEQDPAKRFPALARLIDIDRFLTFMALEVMMCHWDGYTRNRNNYRFYFEPKSGKLQFLPHGMDQMFGDPNFSIMDGSGSIVGSAVLSNPDWQRRYANRLSALMKVFVPADRLVKRVEALHLRLRPLFVQMGEGWPQEFDGQVQGFKERLLLRAQALTQQHAILRGLPPPNPVLQNSAQGPQPLKFGEDGTAPLRGWYSKSESPDAVLTKDGTPGKANGWKLVIGAGPSGQCIASWRTRVVLPAGTYRFEARARCQGVAALEDGPGLGAGIRVSGGQRSNSLRGSSGWTVLKHEIRIDAPLQEVELIAELRATSGQVTFEADSLRLVKLGQ